jgi:VIT1/CCC1 family predicted Fe2+/Mn2+ transporter
MPTIAHIEKHFTATETVRDVIMADGLTVPFALAAGLSAAVSNTSVIVTAGLAEIAAGAIAMGLGGYLAARTDAQHFASEQAREEWEIDNKREFEINEVRKIFTECGLTGGALDSVVASITSDRKR